MPKKSVSALFLAIFILTGGLSCGIKTSTPPKQVTLKYWRAWDDADAFGDIIKKYNAIHPNIKIEYRKFRYAEYEKELLDALAEDRGPDIFSIPNTWVRKYQNKILPLPENIKLVYLEMQGSIKKELVRVERTDKTLSARELKNNFVDQVYNDAVVKVTDEKTKATQEKIFGLPLFLDTLAMYYNKDLLNNAGIAEVPSVWNKNFLQDVKKLTKQNTKGEIIQSGVALGGSANIDRASDILSVLMMQNGAVMLSDSGQVLFDSTPADFASQRYNPGLEALRFYADFANPAKEVYSWNKELDNSLKLFEQNKLAITFGYSYLLPQIRADAPKLNFSVAALPQIENSARTVNFANYWLETVSKKSQNANEAWDFIQFATKADQAKTYLAKTKRPTALRSLIEEQKNDPALAVFAEELLTAKSWYEGKDAVAAEQIFQRSARDVPHIEKAMDAGLGISSVAQIRRVAG